MTSEPCQYPLCDVGASESRALIVDPEPISVNLCDEHIAQLEGTADRDADFIRWADAMLGRSG